MNFKRILGIGLVTLCLTGCGETPSATGNENNNTSVYSLKVSNMEIVPGGEFSREKFGTENAFSELSSCAFEGKDRVYTYDHYEIQTFLKGGKEYVLSVYFLDNTVRTSEGLGFGDTLARMKELYGEDYKESGTMYEYVKGNTTLKVILQNDVVSSIEYVFDVDSLK